MTNVAALFLLLATGEPVVCLQPLGAHDAKLLPIIERGVRDLYGLEVRVLAAQPLAKAAWYAPRQRHRADVLLEVLKAGAPAECRWVVGFTSKDISTSKPPHDDWGIFGLGGLGERASVVSTFRLGADRKLLGERLVKVVNHELGHCFGLDHCPHTTCLMEDAAGTIKTVDNETGLLCERCAGWVAEHVGVQMRRAPP